MDKTLSIWHLHDKYSLDEAAWLMVGIDPYKLCLDDHEDAVTRSARGALGKAIHDFGDNGLYAEVYDSVPFEAFLADPSFDPCPSGVAVKPQVFKTDLIQWLDHKKHYPPFFFPEKSGEPTPTEKENIHVPPDPVATLASDDLPAYLSERLVSFSSLVHDAYKLRLANPKANKATLIDLMCEELGVKDLEARQIDVMIRPPKGK